MLLWWLGLLGLACGGAWAACPQYCSCYADPDGYVSANCSVQALDQAAIAPASSVEMLSFQPALGGYPTRLEPRAFLPFRQAKFLWMVNCSVLNLPNDVFYGLVYVIRLDLSYNKIRQLNGAVFKPMDSLTTLKLRSNPLQLTPWDVIVSDSLQELDLGHCGLRTIPFGTFAGVPRLSRLYLDGNLLRTLTYNTVPVTLRYVNLSRNRIFNVPTEVLTSMSLLRKIDLSKNPVNCTCNLLLMQDWFSGQGILLDNDINCVEPNQYKGMRLSKINENELCTLEEVKRQRRINDIQSYRDPKSHRTHNMIHDPDLQSDQPNGQNYAEVLFHDDGLTHMEMTAKHYSVLPTDLSSENNKVANSKQEIDLVSPTRELGLEGEDESSKEELSPDEASENTTNIDSNEAVSTEIHKTTSEPHISKEIVPNYKPEHTTQSINNISIIPTYVNEIAVSDTHNVSRSPHEELADEGYSPVYNMSDVMLSDGEGSGDDSILTSYLPTDDIKDVNTPTPESFTFPSSHSDGTDYNYDAHHDYSSEVTGSSTEPITTFEGSGESENETAILDTMIPISREEEIDNNTTTETYLITATNSWTSEDYNTSSPQYTSSSEHYSTEESTTEVSPSTEASSSSSMSSIDVFMDFTSEEPSSSSGTPSSSEAPTSSDTPIPFDPHISSSDSPLISSSSESPSSSTTAEFPDFPVISTETFDFGDEEDEHKEETTASQLPIASTTSSIFSSSTKEPSTSSLAPVSEVEVLKENESGTNEQISVGTSQEERPVQSTLTYIIVGLLVALILAVALVLICKRVSGTKKKVRLPKDLEASPGTELQDMLLPRPAENGVKILPTNGKEKEKEEEKQVLSEKDWDDKNEPIETVTARLTVLAGPQTPVFIHKTLA